MRLTIPGKLFAILSLFIALSTTCIAQEKAYFIDGFHGGVWGHYPANYTSFIVEQLKAHPNWKINLEIEPETWAMAKAKDPARL
jgi:alpha-mannosidase